jgi:hypothetical protein
VQRTNALAPDLRVGGEYMKRHRRNDGPRTLSVLADVVRILGTVVVVIWQITRSLHNY